MTKLDIKNAQFIVRIFFYSFLCFECQIINKNQFCRFIPFLQKHKGQNTNISGPNSNWSQEVSPTHVAHPFAFSPEYQKELEDN